ncbi:unnamed protein product [Cyclocybe aegerita]|uniref:Uncharacterized protein n=1 Tax=Cyclocybe aegerita TaxID=1973307 RepID=A0A8S0W5B6_CYCAE|nr:unnamed protein product [Cyclocybe aegerita]
MAAALPPLRNDVGANGLYSRVIMNDYDFGDNRYPTLAAPPKGLQPDAQYTHRPSSRQDRAPADSYSSPSDQSQEPQRSLSYALPPGAARRVVERYSLDDNVQRAPSRGSNETKPTFVESTQDTVTARSRPGTPQASRAMSPQPGRASPNPSTRRNPSQPPNPSPIGSPSGPQFPPIMPLSASPTYNPPVAPNHRAYAQQPTYVTQPNAPNPIQTVYTPIMQQQEEVCVECAMRDQDMADVDVTSPGIWARASDIAFEELKQREREDEANGIVVDDPSRPRIRGGRLTEQNLKLWLSVNPREPTSRQQTLNTYIKSQRTLLEAEALAHARAMQEAKQLDNRMRDAYSQLRRSAYDMGNSSSPTDDLGGVRIKPPLSPGATQPNQAHVRSHSREITLLENGMIVEHVDVRKEEREVRERKKREERRARKSSRSSVMDVTSIISAQSNGRLVENGLKPHSRFSHASSARPTSVLTAPLDRPDLPRAYSQASFSDVHSLGSSSPRRTRFFGMKNLSAGWRSQESFAPSGMSGSMIDMHVALQRESQGPNQFAASPIDLNTPRRSQIWPPADLEDTSAVGPRDGKGKKKKGGLAKIWRIVTGKNDAGQERGLLRRQDDDDLPLAPPPPLSYLVDRKPNDLHSGGMRHTSTPSLPSVVSPKFGASTPGMSPPTAPSSLLPSPVSLRPPGVDVELVDGRNSFYNDGNPVHDERDRRDEVVGKTPSNWKSMHSLTSEPDIGRPPLEPSVPSSPSPFPNNNATNGSANGTAVVGPRPMSLSREKSLPPLPVGEAPAQVLPSDRPRTVYTFDSRALPPGTASPYDFLPPQAAFRTTDTRRQSFSGTSSRPDLAVHTMPVNKPVDFGSNRSFGARYDEFGISRRSLGRLDQVQEQVRAISPLPSSKRKSKFGLASLLGKKNDKRDHDHMQENIGHQFPSMGQHDNQDDMTTNGYTASISRHSALSSGTPNAHPRMSVTSRKALEELVQQDPDFVAYRYPSNDQRLDLLR